MGPAEADPGGGLRGLQPPLWEVFKLVWRPMYPRFETEAQGNSGMAYSLGSEVRRWKTLWQSTNLRIQTLPSNSPLPHSFGPGMFALNFHTYNPLFKKILDPLLVQSVIGYSLRSIYAFKIQWEKPWERGCAFNTYPNKKWPRMI